MDPFDPYHVWLGIPADEQPPHHYRLLGLKLFEESADVIQNAADRQMAHLRTFQAGRHAELSQRLLNEVSAAKLCLLTTTRKQAYDAALRAAHTAAAPPVKRSAIAPFATEGAGHGQPAPQTSTSVPGFVSPALPAIGEAPLPVAPMALPLPEAAPATHRNDRARGVKSGPAKPLRRTAKKAAGWGQLLRGPGLPVALVCLLVFGGVAGWMIFSAHTKPATVLSEKERQTTADNTASAARIVLLWPAGDRAGAEVKLNDRTIRFSNTSGKITPTQVELPVAAGQYQLTIRWADGTHFEHSLRVVPGALAQVAVRRSEPIANALAGRKFEPPAETPTVVSGTGRTAGAQLAGTVSLADIVAGGDGRGSGQRGYGVDPRTGEIVPPQESEKLSKVVPHRFVPSAARLIDGVFIPGSSGPLVVTSTGATLSGLPDTSGETWQYIRSGLYDEAGPEAAIAREALSLHANKGITFDLQAVRQEFGYQALRFVSQVRNRGGAGPNYKADVWVAVDGQLVWKKLGLRPAADEENIDLPLGADVRFLTLIATDGGNGVAHDDVSFIDPKLVSEVAASPPVAMPDKPVVRVTFDQETLFEENGARYLRDLSGNSLHVKLAGGALVPGVVGQALQCDENTVAEIPNHLLLQGGPQATISISVWFFNDGVADGTVIGKNWDDGSKDWNFSIRQDSVRVAGEAKGRDYHTEQPTKFTPGWNQVAMVLDYPNRRWRLFHNGKYIGGDENLRRDASAATAARCYLARWRYDRDRSRDSVGPKTIDELEIYSRALSDQEINALYERSRAGRTLTEVAEPAAVPGECALEFDGRSSVALEGLRFDGQAPLTLEAWVTLGKPQKIACVLGNCEQAGVSLAYENERWNFHVRGAQEYHSATGDAQPAPNERVHLAGVYDQQTVRLFINGKLQSISARTNGVHHASSLPFFLGADPNNRGEPEHEFVGLIHRARVSRTARYQKDFAPPATLAADQDTVAAWACDEGQGEALHDLSGLGHHGKIKGAKWVKVAIPAVPEGQPLLVNANPAAAPIPVPPHIRALGFYEGRQEKHRAELLKLYGGSDASEIAVQKALQWLVQFQLADGGWTFDHNQASGGRGTGAGTAVEARNGATALALLVFLGTGQTHREGRYKENVFRGLSFLGKNGKVDGANVSFHEPKGTMYSQGLVMLALAEAWALTKDRNLVNPCRGGIAYTLNAQHAAGGWRYDPKQAGDTSVTGWQIAALHAYAKTPAPANERRVVQEALVKAGGFLTSVQRDGGALYGYDAERMEGLGTTAVGLNARIYLGWNSDNPILQRAVVRLDATGPDTQEMYYTYYATQVLRQYGGDEWNRWNGQVVDRLLTTQEPQGVDAGSWYFPGKGQGTNSGGRLLHTALAALMLESYYRYMPLCERGWTPIAGISK